MTPTSRTVDELRKLAEAAKSDREWTSDVWIETDGNEWRATGPAHEDPDADDFSPGSPDHERAKRDAAFIAAASPSVVLSLLDRLAAAEAECERLKQRLEFHERDPYYCGLEETLSAVAAARDELADRAAHLATRIGSLDGYYANEVASHHERIGELRAAGSKP